MRMARSNYGSSSMGRRLLSFSLMIIWLPLVLGQQTIDVDWGFDFPKLIEATVGDTMVFTWPTSLFHDVYIHPSGNCADRTGAIAVYPIASSGGEASYTFQPSDGAPEGRDVFFVCQVGEGVHCTYNVNQPVRVFSRTDTDPPTVSPTDSPAPTISPAPTEGPTGSPTLEPSPTPTDSPSQSPTDATPAPSPSPTMSPTAFPSESPTIATPAPSVSLTMSPTTSPSVSPTIATPAPSVSPTMSPTASPSVSPTIATPAPSVSPSLVPSAQPTSSPTSVPSATPTTAPPSIPPSQSPTQVPSKPPTVTPTIATPSPTSGVISTTVEGLEMTLFGVTDLSEEDISNWESVTALYQTAFYADGSNGVLELDSRLQVQDSRRRLQSSDDSSISLIYTQIMLYRSSDPDLTTSDVATQPFSSEERRNQYASIYLNNAEDGTALSDVTGVSPVTAPTPSDPTTSPTLAPATPRGVTDGVQGQIIEDDGLSTGGIVGVAAGVLCVCLFGFVFFVAGQRRRSYEYGDDDNPYMPPSSDSFGKLGGSYEASEEPIEHVYTHNR